MIERLSVFETGLEISPYRQPAMELVQLIHQLKCFQHVPGYRRWHSNCIENAVSVEDMLGALNLSQENFEYLKDNSKLLRHWIPGHSLMSGVQRYVPPLFIRWISSTNGLAAGSTIEDAIIHGFCEVLERWALVLFLRGEHSEYPNVDLNTIEDPEIRDMLTYFNHNDIEVTVKDLTKGGFFPVYAVITRNMALNPRFIGYNTIKAGCHFDANEALKRALTERMQGTSFADERSFGFIDEKEKDLLMPLYLKGICMFDLTEHAKSDTLVPMREFTVKTSAQALDLMRTIAAKLCVDIVVVDHTHPQIKFPVVRVIMPGISDFIGWWQPEKTTLNFLGNIHPEDEIYEGALHRFLNTFKG